MGGGFKKERTHVYLWLLHVAVRQKPRQHCKAIILQFKVNFQKQKIRNSYIKGFNGKGGYPILSDVEFNRHENCKGQMEMLEVKNIKEMRTSFDKFISKPDIDA